MFRFIYLMGVVGIFSLFSCEQQKENNSRVVKSFNFQWKFQLADTLNADQWINVDLPHDWSIEGKFDSVWASGTGYLPGGIGWYQKSFDLESIDEIKKWFIAFDGVYNNSDVWINDQFLGNRPNGYVSFQYDLTPYLNFNGQNTIKVKVDHTKYADSRWYTGSGIYRDVKLIATNKTHIENWGVYAYVSSWTDSGAVLEIETDVINESDAGQSIAIKQQLYFGDKLVQEIEELISLNSRENQKRKLNMLVQNPIRWDVDDPNLYRLETIIHSSGVELDRLSTDIGFRKTRFDPDMGFFLNGKNRKLKGICMHHDAGTFGAAVPKPVLSRRLDRLKEMGCNAIRTSHNPFSPDFYDLCNEKGFLVLDEIFDEWEMPKNKWVKGWNNGAPSMDGYAEHFSEWSKRDLQDVVKRDRNHPSIIMWSIGNEVDYPNDPYTHEILNTEDNPQTSAKFDPSKPHSNRLGEIAKELTLAVKELDESRPVTAGLASALVSNETGYAEALDVAGYNYQEFRYESDHARFPNRPLYGSENGMSLSAWEVVENNDYVIGQFLWTGIEYLGEAGQFPRRHSTSGLIDLAGNGKNEFYFRQSLWSNEPMVHMVVSDEPVKMNSKDLWSHRKGAPHWNWEKNQALTVAVYTNSESVMLLLNGKPLARKYLKDYPGRVITYDLPFESGNLIVIGEVGGKEVTRDSLVTAGKPIKLMAKILSMDDYKNGKLAHIQVQVMDANTDLVYNSEVNISVSTKGAVKLLGLEDANPINIENYKDYVQKSYKGKLMAYVWIDAFEGDNELVFESEDLEPITIKLNTQ
ncbi:MAG: DUF4982 domain-containing protein [Reichenbachiella sp.]